MKTIIASVISLLALGTLSCTRSSVEVSPISSVSNARGGSPTSTSATSTTTAPPATPTPGDPVAYENVRATLESTNWTVKYIRGGSERSADFAGVKFTFTEAGDVIGTDSKGIETHGRWQSYVAGITYYAFGSTYASIVLGFDKSTLKAFFLLSKQWNLNPNSTTNDIILDNPEPTANEHLEFIR